MADGFRVLENGDSRITEASVFRITERFTLGEATLAGTGTLSASPTVSFIVSSALTGTGTLAAIGTVSYTHLTLPTIYSV